MPGKGKKRGMFLGNPTEFRKHNLDGMELCGGTLLGCVIVYPY